MGIAFVSNEEKQKLLNLGVQHFRDVQSMPGWKQAIKAAGGDQVAGNYVMTGNLTSPGYRRVRLSHLIVEVVVGPKEVELKRDGRPEPEQVRVNLLHLFTHNVHATERLRNRVTELVDAAMHHLFRIGREHVDYRLEWVPEPESFCLTIVGAHLEPDIDDRLMKMGALVNAQLDKERFLTKR